MPSGIDFCGDVAINHCDPCRQRHRALQLLGGGFAIARSLSAIPLSPIFRQPSNCDDITAAVNIGSDCVFNRPVLCDKPGLPTAGCLFSDPVWDSESYQLQSGSPCVGAGSDGRNIGISLILKAISLNLLDNAKSEFYPHSFAYAGF